MKGIDVWLKSDWMGKRNSVVRVMLHDVNVWHWQVPLATIEISLETVKLENVSKNKPLCSVKASYRQGLKTQHTWESWAELNDSHWLLKSRLIEMIAWCITLHLTLSLSLNANAKCSEQVVNDTNCQQIFQQPNNEKEKIKELSMWHKCCPQFFK